LAQPPSPPLGSLVKKSWNRKDFPLIDVAFITS
jgi:hypothetical protein